LTQTRWRIRLRAEAEKDFVRILRYTRDTFGQRQADVYRTTLVEALAALEAGPDIPAASRAMKFFPTFGRSMSRAMVGADGISSYIDQVTARWSTS
jgi:plasmid stabilization system protein ParE